MGRKKGGCAQETGDENVRTDTEFRSAKHRPPGVSPAGQLWHPSRSSHATPSRMATRGVRQSIPLQALPPAGAVRPSPFSYLGLRTDKSTIHILRGRACNGSWQVHCRASCPTLDFVGIALPSALFASAYTEGRLLQVLPSNVEICVSGSLFYTSAPVTHQIGSPVSNFNSMAVGGRRTCTGPCVWLSNPPAGNARRSKKRACICRYSFRSE